MIKVGQIYEHNITKRKTIITYIDEEIISIIQDNGRIYKIYDYQIDTWYTLLIEYPTWQEAVNSKEFKE